MSLNSLLAVHIDFATSHLVFPTIISVILAVLLVAILVTRWRIITAVVTRGPVAVSGFDGIRLFGTLAITIAYFIAMPQVGLVFPNTGLGFLICSGPYLLVLGLLYLHERSVRRIVPVLLTAAVAPALVWWLLSDVFFITLP